HSPDHVSHFPRTFIARGQIIESPERPERAEVLLKALAAAGHAIEAPAHHDLGPVEAVHDAGYLAFLREGYQAWRGLPGASAEVIPNIHPGRNMARATSHPIARAG